MQQSIRVILAADTLLQLLTSTKCPLFNQLQIPSKSYFIRGAISNTVELKIANDRSYSNNTSSYSYFEVGQCFDAWIDKTIIQRVRGSVHGLESEMK